MFDFRRCTHVTLSERLRRGKWRRKESFLSEEQMKIVVRDTPLEERVYLPNERYRFTVSYRTRKPNGSLVKVTLTVHFRGHEWCVIFRIHTA